MTKKNFWQNKNILQQQLHKMQGFSGIAVSAQQKNKQKINRSRTLAHRVAAKR